MNMKVEVTSQVTQVNVSVDPIAVEVIADPIAVAVTTGIQGPAGTSGGLAYRTTFVDADLTVAGLLLVNHNLNRATPLSVQVFTASGEPVFPDAITILNSNLLAVGLNSFRPLGGTWQVAVGA